jgi:hypothetical protein
MLRRIGLGAAVLVILVSSGLWVRARIAERCPVVGVPTSIEGLRAERDVWRFADVTIGSRQYTIQPSVTADFGAYVRPFPVPESHRVGVSITVQASQADAVRAWRTVCLRLTHGDRSEERPTGTNDSLLNSPATPGFYYRFDGASGFPEWPPGDSVDVEILFIVDGATYILRMPSVPIGSMG